MLKFVFLFSVMQCERKFHFKDEKNALEVIVLEVVDPQYGLFTWPSAVILAQYVWFQRNELRNKQVIELGAGTALPGVVAALCGANVTLTDGEQYTNCLENCHKTCTMNGLINVNITALSWGSFSKTLLELPKFDIILGSDCFYDPKDFDDVLATVAFLIDRNPGAEFWTSYQERSADWSIEILLQKWNLVCRQIPSSSFGCENMVERDFVKNHCIQLLVITRLGK